ncbi:hypothetical protein TNCV_1898961 [Trichonephila clavipes]|nr:hypothetical protein TNCV_1898961 [Trichonephila clavipes]
MQDSQKYQILWCQKKWKSWILKLCVSRLLMKCLRKFLCYIFDYPAVSSEFIAVKDDSACTGPIVADKDIFEFVQSSKNIIDVDSDRENDANNADPVPTSSGMRNIMRAAI